MAGKSKVRADDAPRTGNNPFEDPFTEEMISAYEDYDDKCEKLMMDAMRKCKPHRDEQRALLDQAGSRGMNKRALRTHLKERKLDRQKEKLREKLEGDDRDAHELLLQHLGVLVDTPLGQAAVAAAESGK